MTINKLSKSCPRLKSSSSVSKNTKSIKILYKTDNNAEEYYSLVEMMEAIEHWVDNKYCPSKFDLY